MKDTMIPVGPGKGQTKPMIDALRSIIQEMRGHIRDLRDGEELEKAELLDLYETAMELVWRQNQDETISGLGLPDELIDRARKYHLAAPNDKGRKSSTFLDYFGS